MTTGHARAAHLNDEQRRCFESINKELMHVTWELTWELEEVKDTLPNLLLPTADQTLDNLERQGFDMSNKANTWIQELDTDLRNKVTFDIHLTNPQVDIQPTGSCEF